MHSQRISLTCAPGGENHRGNQLIGVPPTKGSGLKYGDLVILSNDLKKKYGEKVELYDMFSDKMYMDLYADYSLADYKYRQNMNDSGFHFAYFGEIWHGIFAGFFSILVIYFKFFNLDNKKYHLAYFTLGITQLVMITWYISPAILELFLENNQNHWTKTWWPPYLWNLPWFILPSILIYHGTKNILST